MRTKLIVLGVAFLILMSVMTFVCMENSSKNKSILMNCKCKCEQVKK